MSSFFILYQFMPGLSSWETNSLLSHTSALHVTISEDTIHWVMGNHHWPSHWRKLTLPHSSSRNCLWHLPMGVATWALSLSVMECWLAWFCGAFPSNHCWCEVMSAAVLLSPEDPLSQLLWALALMISVSALVCSLSFVGGEGMVFESYLGWTLQGRCSVNSIQGFWLYSVGKTM